MPVKITVLERDEAAQELRLLGEVQSSRQATVRAQTSGVVQSVLARAGDTVVAGQPLVMLDVADQRLAAAEARARLAQASSRLTELEAGTRPQVLDQKQAELRAAAARREEAEQNLLSSRELGPSLVAQRQAAVHSARAREKDARDQWERNQVLFARGAVPKRDQIQSEAAYEEARAGRLEAEYAYQAEITRTRQTLIQAEQGLEAARGDLAGARAQLEEAVEGPRVEEVMAQRGVVEAAQAQLDAAQLAYDRTQVRAPISGAVVSRSVNVGDRLQPNDDVATLIGEGGGVDILLEVPEDLAGQVKAGATVVVTTKARPGWSLDTALTAVVPATDPRSHRQTARISLETPPPELLPGMAVEARLSLPARGEFLVVSRDALVKRGPRWVVYTLVEGKAHEVQVELVTDLGRTVAIRSDELKNGQEVVLQGGEGLYEGAVALPSGGAPPGGAPQ